MAIRTFYGKTIVDVMAQIRQEIGTSGFILESAHDKNGLRITVACSEGDLFIAEEETCQPLSPRSIRHVPSQSSGEKHYRLETLRQCFSYHGLSPEQAGFSPISHFLTEGGQASEGTAQDLLSQWLSGNLTFKPLLFKDKRRVMLLGGPGVGKTTMMTRLAVRALGEGFSPVLLTTDVEKAGGVDQVRLFAEALQIPFFVCPTAHHLGAQLQSLDPNHVVLIDTPGINPRESEEMRWMAEMVLTAKVSPIHVSPAGEHPLMTDYLARQFFKLGARRMLITRVDLYDRLGGALAAAFHTKMSLVGWSRSPYVAQSFVEASSEGLARQLLQASGGLEDAFVSEEFLSETAA